MVFRKLREEWNISDEDYMLSVGPQQILSMRWYMLAIVC